MALNATVLILANSPMAFYLYDCIYRTLLVLLKKKKYRGMLALLFMNTLSQDVFWKLLFCLIFLVGVKR
jgi:hypothetical protein